MIPYSDGKVEIDKGSSSNMGYYQVRTGIDERIQSPTCVSGQGYPYYPTLGELEVEAIEQ